MPTPASATVDCHARARARRGVRGPALRPAALASLASALLLAGCAGTPVRRGEVSMQAPINADTGCFAPRPNPRAAYNRDYRVLGRTYAPLRSANGYQADGTASWYGWESGKTTSMGTYFNPRAFTAASRVLPLPTCVEVTNLRNGRSALVLVNDRGPFVDSRIMDLSYGAAKALGVTATGTAPVRIVALAPDQLQSAPAAALQAPVPAPATAAPATPAAAPPQTRFPQAPPAAAAQPQPAASAAIQITPLPALTEPPAPGASAASAPAGVAPGTPQPAAPTEAASAPGGDSLGAWLASAGAGAGASQAASDTPPRVAAAARAPLPAGTPETYVQTGAFTIEANARLEADRLRRAGVSDVEVVPGFANGRTWYKVQIGPLPGGAQEPGLADRLARLGLRSYTFVQQ